MSAMRKAMQYLGFEVSNHDDYGYEYADEELAPVTDINDVSRVRESRHESRSSRSGHPRTGSVRQPATGDLRRIQTIKPRTYSDAKLIGEAFRQGVPVIMNLTEMTESDARRMVDFAAGLQFGLRGSFERVTTAVFLLSPAHVEIGVDEHRAESEHAFFH